MKDKFVLILDHSFMVSHTRRMYRHGGSAQSMKMRNSSRHQINGPFSCRIGEHLLTRLELSIPPPSSPKIQWGAGMHTFYVVVS